MGNFTYNSGVPNPPNRPSADVPLMQTNTNNIPLYLGIDHVPFQTGHTTDGYHQQIHLLNESAPGIGTANGVLFANNPVAQSWPTWQNANTITYQIIGANANADAAGTSFSAFGAFGTITVNYTQSAGWTFLPGGMILQYGQVLSSLGTPQISPSTIAVGFPVVYSTANIVVTITPICKSGGTSQAHVASLQAGTLATSGFTCNFDTSTTSYIGFTWTAIGK